MSEVKRLNYFKYQFLVEEDFKDEQTYHKDMRHRHNRYLHDWGIAEGLDVSIDTSGGVNKAVVAPGLALDSDGNEIVVVSGSAYNTADIPALSAGDEAFVTVTYRDVSDNADLYTSPSGQVEDYRRTTERPLVEVKDTAASDGSEIVLARLYLDAGALAIDTTVRKNAASAQPVVSVEGVSVSGGNIDLVPTNAISIVGDDTNKQITIGETHSALTTNPHATTAAQIDTQEGANGIATQINAGSGIIAEARIDSSIARDSEVSARFDPATGHSHNGTDSKQLTPTDLGALASVSGVSSNTTGNIDLIAGSAIAITPDTVNKRITIASTYGTREIANVQFNETDASDATRTLTIGFEPKLIHVTGGASAKMDGKWFGAPLSGFADRANNFVSCPGIQFFKDGSIENIQVNNSSYLCYLDSYCNITPKPRYEYVYVYISNSTSTGFTVTLYRWTDPVTYDPIEKFNLDLSLLCLG